MRMSSAAVGASWYALLNDCAQNQCHDDHGSTHYFQHFLRSVLTVLWKMYDFTAS